MGRPEVVDPKPEPDPKQEDMVENSVPGTADEVAAQYEVDKIGQADPK